MSRQNCDLVCRWFDEVWNQRKAETIEELIQDDSVCFTDEGPMQGPVGFREMQLKPILEAFPDLRVNVESVLGDGEEVAVRWSAKATHTGSAFGIAPTKKPIDVHGISWVHVRDGKMMVGWQHSNLPAVLRSLAVEAESQANAK